MEEERQQMPQFTFNAPVNIYGGTLSGNVTNYNYGKEATTNVEDRELAKQMAGIFYGDEENALEFIGLVRGMKPVAVTGIVNQWLKEKKISDKSKGKDLWEILNKNGLYDAGYANWNSYVK